MKNISTNTAIIIIVLLLGGLVYFITAFKQNNLPKRFACTMEAMICPDGSAVGRTGPNCEFSKCPEVSYPVSTTTNDIKNNQEGSFKSVFSLKVGESKNIQNTQVILDKIISDSRCPKDVTCIWAGEVSISVSLKEGSRTETVTLKDTSPIVVTKNYDLLLLRVLPEKISTIQTKESDYLVTLEIRARN